MATGESFNCTRKVGPGMSILETVAELNPDAFFAFNVVGAYVGENGPIFMET